MRNAAKVGLLLVVFVILLVGGYSILGKSLFAQKPDRYLANFEDAGGVTEGTPVLLAGVNVGMVSKVSLLGPHLAQLALDVKPKTFVPEGTQVVIPSSLIGLGSNPVTLVPPERTSGVAADRRVPLEGRRGNALDNVLPNSKETVAELTRTMAAVRKLLEDQKLVGRVETLLATSNQTIERFGKLANNVDATLVANQANLNRAIASATNAMQDVRRMTNTFANYVQQGKIQGNVDGILARIQTIEKHADQLVLSLDRLVNDPKLRQPADQIAANVAQITKTGTGIAENTEAITKNGIEISKNVTTISAKAITLTDQANEIAKNAIDIENQLKGVLDKVGGFFGKSGKGHSFNLSSELDVMRETEPNRWRTDVTFSTPLPDGTLYAGIYDAFEQNRLTIEVGKPIRPSLSYRYGIYASKPAVGVDYSFSRNGTLRFDAWNVNDPRLDLRARYEFGNGLIGWIGVDRVFRDNAPTIGFGIRR